MISPRFIEQCRNPGEISGFRFPWRHDPSRSYCQTASWNFGKQARIFSQAIIGLQINPVLKPSGEKLNLHGLIFSRLKTASNS